eukprot:15432085-Alexandrium_andersonii.AAC.1
MKVGHVRRTVIVSALARVFAASSACACTFAHRHAKQMHSFAIPVAPHPHPAGVAALAAAVSTVSAAAYVAGLSASSAACRQGAVVTQVTGASTPPTSLCSRSASLTRPLPPRWLRHALGTALAG